MTGLCILTHGRGANGEPLQREAEIGMLCLNHKRRLSRLMIDVRDLWVDAHHLAVAGTAPKDDTPRTRHTKAAEAPAPANLDLIAIRDHRTKAARITDDQSDPINPTRAIVVSWMQLVAEERPIEHVPSSLLACIDLMHRHGDWIAGQPWVDDFITDWDDMRRALSGIARDQPWRTVGQCYLDRDGQPCGGDLTKENGSDVVACRRCGASWVTDQQRARLGYALGQEAS